MENIKKRDINLSKKYEEDLTFKELQNELFKETIDKKEEEDEREEISNSFQSIKEKDINDSYVDTRNMMLSARDGLRNASNPLEATSEKLRGAEKIYSNYGSVIMTSQFYLKELKKK